MESIEPGDRVRITNNGDHESHTLRVFVDVGTPGVVIAQYSIDIPAGPDARYIVEFDDAHPSGRSIRQHVAADQLTRVA